MEHKLDREALVFRIADHNGGVVFAPESRAMLVDRIHRALGASTWGAFRRTLPPAEYEKILRIYENDGDPVPEDADPFDPEAVPGWSDGDFPAWLQCEMPEHISTEVLSRYGVLRTTAVNGSFWWIAPERIPAITEDLAAMGWCIRHAPELSFW